jgi:hypothetical protein
MASGWGCTIPARQKQRLLTEARYGGSSDVCVTSQMGRVFRERLLYRSLVPVAQLHECQGWFNPRLRNI